MKKRINLCAVCVFVMLGAVSWVQAQTQITTGVIQGTVLDPTGALVSGANVEVKNLDTNLTRALVTGDDGRFVFLQLPSGPYTLTVMRSGFATLLQENLDVTVGKAITLSLTMKVSQIEETITVTGVPTVDTTKTEASTTLNELAIENTPVLGRKFEDLLSLTPGVSIVQGPDGDEINFAGQRGIFNNISLDGGDYNNGFFGEQVGGQRAQIDISMEAVKEFQVISTGGSAEFGRTAGGIVNVITKSGTNEVHGSLFHFQRLEALTANTSTGEPLTDFHREQFGGTIGGPIVRDKAFFFGAFEQITANLTRANLSLPSGTPCPQSSFMIGNPADEALIASTPDCQRVALLNFFRDTRNQEEGLPTERPIRNAALLGKLDWNVTDNNQLGVSYSFDRSKNTNETFDVANYGNSANGIEGTSYIQSVRVNLLSTISSNVVNEAHFTYLREKRPREAVESNVPADTGIGFAPNYRFGSPFFLHPNIDELFWRTQIKDNVSIISGGHTIKFGGEWIHSLNDQVFRGFFLGRYLFDSVTGFLRYASPAGPGGFGPQTVTCSDGSFVTYPSACPAGANPTGGPLLYFRQDGATGLPDVPPPGKSTIDNEDIAFFVQDQWRIAPNFTLNFGLRWEAQYLADTAIPPENTAYGIYLNNPNFPSDGTLPDDTNMIQPRLGFAWDLFNNQKSVLRAGSGIYYGRQNMLTQVGSITTNGAQNQTIFRNTDLIPILGPPPSWPNIFPVTPLPPGTFPFQPDVTFFAKNYKNPRITSVNVAFEQELYPNLALYLDFTWAKSVNLTRFINPNVSNDPAVNNGRTIIPDGASSTLDVTYTGPTPFPAIGAGFTTMIDSSAKSLYRGFTVGMRKRFSQGFQLEWNYVYSKDLDDDSNERDPFTFRYLDRFDFQREYALSDRDIRHKFNFYTFMDLPGGFEANVRIQGRTAQPISESPRVQNGMDVGRNTLRKDNKFFSLDWRLSRPFAWRDGRYAITPTFEMFNTFNNDNNVNPLSTPVLFNFDGFLRAGVGDPLQAQLAVKFTF